ncbi:hypothetical protein F442_07471, partial [Phytophthora nicotianae P10297]
WSKVTGRPVEFFAPETGSDGKTVIQLANDVVPKYLSLSLQSKISRGDTNKEICFDDVVGYLADGAWLNDAVISYCPDVMTENRDDVHVLSSLVIQKEKFPTPPRRKPFSMKSVVLPINNSNAHWTIIIVVVDRYGELRPHFYDPLTADVEEQRDVVEIGKQLSRAFVQGRKKVWN